MFPRTTTYDDRDIEIVATALMEYAGTPDCHLPGTANERAIELVEVLAVAHGARVDQLLDPSKPLPRQPKKRPESGER